MHTMNKRNKERGFTLIELSIVIMIVGFILVPLFAYYEVRREQETIDKTAFAINNAETYIAGFRTMYGRYPCPAPMDAAPGDLDYGHENDCDASISGVETAFSNRGDLSSPNDEIYIGSLPFRQMNIQEQDSFDGYGNRLTYAVTASLTDNANFDETLGAISIVDENNNNVLAIPHSAQFVVLSHGENENGAIKRDGIRVGTCPSGQLDSENCDNDETFMKSNARQGYDDTIVHATDALINPWKYVDETSEHVTLSDAVGFGLGNPGELALESASGLMVFEALTDDAVALSSGGAFMSNLFCDYDDDNCFQSSLIGGQIVEGEGISCPPNEFLIGIGANGTPDCSESIRLSCRDGNYLVAISPSGEMKCSEPLAPDCPEMSVAPSCGGPEVILGETFSDDNDYVESGECYTFDTFSNSEAAAQPTIADLESYVDNLNAGTRSSGSCDLVRDNYVCEEGAWTQAESHERWNYNASFPGDPWQDGYRVAETDGEPYSLTGSRTANDCWCREDYRVDTYDCPSGYEGNSVIVRKHRCPQTRGSWRTIYRDEETFCGCAPYTDTDTESCRNYYDVSWYGMSGNVEYTYDNTCDAGGNIVTDPSPAVDTSNCTCPSRWDRVSTTSCPQGETNSFTFNGRNYTGKSEVRIYEWTCPNGEGNPVSSASDAGYWSDTPITHNEACVCDSDLTDLETEPCPTGYSGSGLQYEREWDCAAEEWEPRDQWELVADNCQACFWKRPSSQPESGSVGIGDEIGSGGCACGTTGPCYEKGGAEAFENFNSCSCSP